MKINTVNMEYRIELSIRYLPKLIKETTEEVQMLEEALQVLNSDDERYLDDHMHLKVLYDKLFGKLVNLHTLFAKNTANIESLLSDIDNAVKNKWPED